MEIHQSRGTHGLTICGTVRGKKCMISHFMHILGNGPTLFYTVTVKPNRRGRSLLYRTSSVIINKYLLMANPFEIFRC